MTLKIPSPFLYNNHLEIYVGLSANADVPGDATGFLTPTFQAGRDEMNKFQVRVHKTLLASDDLNFVRNVSIRTLGYPRAHRTGAIECLFTEAGDEGLDMSIPSDRFLKGSLTKADKALSAMREPSGDPDIFTRAWTSSDFNRVLHWLRFNTSNHGLTPPIVHSEWISRLLGNATSQIRKATKGAITHRDIDEIDDAQQFQTALQTWSENAHGELRDRLEPARLGSMWKSLTWWKLPLRSDDVTMCLTGILERSWLVNAEKELIWLGGRLEQAGLSASRTTSAGLSSESPSAATITNGRPAPGGALSSSAMIPHSIPSLSEARRNLVMTSIAPLAAQAQAFVLNAGSITFFTSALATLVYLSPPLTSLSTLFEAGAIAAFGLAYSSYRLQIQWEAARSTWLTSVQQHGRDTLRNVEEWLGQISKTAVPMHEKLENGVPVPSSNLKRASNALSRVESEFHKTLEGASQNQVKEWSDVGNGSSSLTQQKPARSSKQDHEQAFQTGNPTPRVRYTNRSR